jgi:hypothetical protein
MSCNVIGKSNPQPMPCLLLLVPLSRFLDFDVHLPKHEGRCEIVPVGVSSKVGQMEIVSRGRIGVPSERSLWIVARLKDVTICGLNAHSIGSVYAKHVRGSKSGEPEGTGRVNGRPPRPELVLLK